MRTIITTFKRKFSSLFKTNPRLAIFSSVSLLIFIFGVTLFSFKYLLPDTQIAIAEANKQNSQTVKQIESAKISTDKKIKVHKPIIDVHIATTGMTYIQGAEVVSITGPTIVVSTIWNTLILQWTIHTNESYYGTRHFGTNFFNRKGERVSLLDIHVGDSITISGDLEANMTTPTIMANTIRTSY